MGTILDPKNNWILQDYKWLNIIRPMRERQVRKAIKAINKLPREYKRDLLSNYKDVLEEVVGNIIDEASYEIFTRVYQATDQLSEEVELKYRNNELTPFAGGKARILVEMDLDKFKRTKMIEVNKL